MQPLTMLIQLKKFCRSPQWETGNIVSVSSPDPHWVRKWVGHSACHLSFLGW